MIVDKNSEIYKFLNQYMCPAENVTPETDEVVLAIKFSKDCFLCQNIFYGIPSTFAYFDHKNDKWTDNSYNKNDEKYLDYRDINNNRCSCGEGDPLFFAYKTQLSRILKHFYDLHNEHQEKLKME